MKKKLLFLVAAFALFVPSVMAAEIVVDTDLASKVASASDGDTLKLTKDVEVSATIAINKDLTLNLNGKNVTFLNSKTNFEVKGGKLTVTGAGKIVEKVPYYAPIYIIGSTNEADTDYSVVTIGKDVVLEGWAGIFVRETASNTAYGVKVTFNGTINNKPDGDDKGHGIYINGNIQHTKNAPVINIGDTAVINSQGTGIYAAGYAIWNIGKAKISGVECGLGIKSGVFNIDGATITATGEDTTPTAGYSNGINPSGAAIQIEANKAYAGKIELNIKSGTFTSEKGIAVYEYLDTNSSTPATDTAVKTIAIEGGKFTSAANKPVMALSDEFVEAHTATEFIEDGTFKSGDKDTIVGTVDGDFLPVEETVQLTAYLYVDGVKTAEDVIYVKKGTALGEGFETSFKGAIEDVGYIYNGTFTDEKLKNKFDFKAELEEDSVIYMSTSTVKEEEPKEEPEEEKKDETPKTDVKEETKKEENPKTGDLNLVLIIGTILVGTLGVVVTSKKISAKVTR